MFDMTKAIWTFSAVAAIALGLILPAPALFGNHSHKLIHAGSTRG
jgi:hypothetical protein